MKYFLIVFAASFSHCLAAVIYERNSGSGAYADSYSDQGDDGSQSIIGTAGIDYPAFHQIPATGFNCRSFPQPGYYADQESQCQVFHVCQADGDKDSFLCPNGTVFNQQYFICDWWYNVDCAQASNFYSLNNELYRVAPKDNSDYSGSSSTGPAYSSSPRPSGYGASTSGNIYDSPSSINEPNFYQDYPKKQ